MSDLNADGISLVLPTFNRAGALRRNLDAMLALEGVDEIVVVDDGSTDDTIEACAEFADERLKLVSHPHNLGVANARNTGVDASSGSWVLFGEDDCRFPVDYAIVLRAEAERHAGDIIGAPLFYLDGTDEDVAPQVAAMPRTVRMPSIENSEAFPMHTIETPFLPARVLIRRTVFDDVRFYEGYSHNGYREETDFFIQAARGGFRCLLTPETYCYQLDAWRGGQHHSSRVRYEYWAIVNNWRFLRRHGSWLTQEGYIGGVASAQMQFALHRAHVVGTGVVRTRLSRLRSVAKRQGQASAAG
jgi:glycosyltransferase involved in cell wall biosynthesis